MFATICIIGIFLVLALAAGAVLLAFWILRNIE